MATLRSYLLAFFAITTFVLATMVWTQHLDLISLRDGDKLSDAERDALQRKVLLAEKHQHELEDELAALRAKNAEKALADGEGAADSTSAPQNAGRRGQNGRFANMQALMNDPKFAKLLALQQKAQLDSRYAALFKQLGLSPAQVDAFKNLLLQKQNAARDVLTAARDQGLDPRTDRTTINQLIAQSNAEADSQIEAALGATAFQQYQSFEQTLPQRSTVNQLQQSLSYTGTPLQDTQAEQLVQLLASNASKTSNPTSLRALQGGGGPFGAQGAPITDQEITQAQGLLSQPQIAALQQIQQQQQAQAQMMQLLRSAAQQNRGAAPAGTTTTAAKP
ncbi:MAG TPA: hypothetical protein VK717_12230 [Opitutaceae bacterium]|nr:hypothetical protein [Opitutaceae bacterium]